MLHPLPELQSSLFLPTASTSTRSTPSCLYTMSSPPAHLILAVNAGSSSLKISLFRRDSPSHSAAPSPAHPHDAVTLLLNASISNISAPPARFSFARADHDDPVTYGDDVKDASIDSITDHASAFAHFLDHLAVDPASITHVCHRVVHGGDYYAPVIISDESFHHIEALSDLAPLCVSSRILIRR